MVQKPTLDLPKISLSSLRQVFFVIKEVFKIAWVTSPGMLIGSVFFSSVWGLTNLPSLFITKLMIDGVITGLTSPNKLESVKWVGFLLTLNVLVDLLRRVSSRLISTYDNNLSRRLTYKVGILIGLRNSELDIPTIEDPQFKDRFNKVEREGGQRIWQLIPPIINVPNNLIGIISTLLIVSSVSPLVAVIVIIVSIPQLFVNARFIKKEYTFETDSSATYRLIGWMSYFLTRTTNYFEQRILGNNQYLASRIGELSGKVIAAKEELRSQRVKYRTIADLPGLFFLLGFNIWLFAQAIFGKITLGTAQMIYNASTTFQNNLTNMVNDFLTVYENYLYMLDLVWIINLRPAVTNGTKHPKTPFKYGVQFKDVWFKYPKTDRWILKGINLEITPHENIAIVGENGAGKTTLIKLLCGFYEATKGEVLINGVNIKSYDKKCYWKILSVLFQDFESYPFTARESIGYGNIEKLENLAAIQDAARKTDVHEFIDNLPLKYENPLTKEFDRGIEPSKGQWQRIALSRALYKNGEIVILDEPTSNVDPAAEEEIFDKVISLTKNKILILISHRFSTVRRADKIFVIDKGKIMESGSHEELLKAKQTYAHLFNLQAKGYQ